MTTIPDAFSVHAVPHPAAPVRQAGFPLDHPYLEHCWTPVLGPSSVLLLRRCAWLWREAEPVTVPTADLAAQLGLGRGTARSSPVWHTLERVMRFRFAAMPSAGELHVYTEVPPLPAHQLDRLPAWCRTEHERLLGQHLDGLARSSGPRNAHAAVGEVEVPPPHLRMSERLTRVTDSATPSARAISR